MMASPTQADVQDELRAWSQTPGGQMILGYLVARFGFQMSSTFTGDADKCLFQEGQRSVISHLTFLVNGPDLRQIDPDVENQVQTGIGDL